MVEKNSRSIRAKKDSLSLVFETVSVAISADPLGETNIFFVQILGGENLLKLFSASSKPTRICTALFE